MSRPRRSPVVGAEPLPPRRKWRAIMLATLLLVPAYWALLFGIVSAVSDDATEPGGPFIAFGLALIPFVFVALAFLSEHPRPPGAVLRAMGLSLLVGVPVAAVTQDVVSGFVAGIGAGGVTALRSELVHRWTVRAIAVAAATAYVFLLVRVFPEIAVLLTPILPFTSIGISDHLAERGRERPTAEAR